MRRFYAPAENFHGETVSLSRDESRHLANVLRLSFGDKVNVFNGLGGEFLCEIGATLKTQTSLKIIKEINPVAPESSLDLTLAVSLLKGDKFDLVIQKAVELGSKKFIPITSIRCEVKLRNPEKKLERWRKIVVESTKQCGRARLMTVAEPIDFTNLIPPNEQNCYLFSERDGEKLPNEVSDNKITAIIGPEGGWDDSELEFARRKNVQIITLGGRILRAETAGISIPTILQNKFGDIN